MAKQHAIYKHHLTVEIWIFLTLHIVVQQERNIHVKAFLPLVLLIDTMEILYHKRGNAILKHFYMLVRHSTLTISSAQGQGNIWA
jgi:hypothetical protein